MATIKKNFKIVCKLIGVEERDCINIITSYTHVKLKGYYKTHWPKLLT